MNDKRPILKKGDMIGLIAPGSSLTQAKIDFAIHNTKLLGLNPLLGKYVLDQFGYLAGNDKDRISDIHDMFRNKDVKAIWSLRGGYGCTRIINQLNYGLINDNPKPIIGYSDITALLLAIYKKTKQRGYHANILATEWDEFTLDKHQNILFDNQNSILLQSINYPDSFTPFTINKGTASGKLIGGNLSLLVSLIGTPFAPKYKNKIVFIEDVEEKPYRIDRMITHLREGSDLLKAAGIVLGHFSHCQPEKDDISLTLLETLKLNLGDSNIPCYYGAPFGHIKNIAPIPIGVDAKMDADQMTLSF